MIIDIAIAVIFIFLILFLWIIYTRPFGAEWVKTPKRARKKMLQMLRLSKRDILYDLGCGDGQFLLEASPKVRQAIGIEIDPVRCLIAKFKARNRKNIKIVCGNLFKQNIRSTKIVVFLLKGTNEKLGKKLKQECRNALIVSYKWPVAGLKLLKYDEKNRAYLQRP